MSATNLAYGDAVSSITSSNTTVAKISSKRWVVAKKAGKAKITVTLKSGKKASFAVKVQKKDVATTAIQGVKASLTLKVGKTALLTPSLIPVTSLQTITYRSNNKNVAVVNKNGKITAKKKGTADITVTSGSVSVTCKVKVK